jgi:hypothetical protein
MSNVNATEERKKEPTKYVGFHCPQSIRQFFYWRATLAPRSLSQEIVAQLRSRKRELERKKA